MSRSVILLLITCLVGCGGATHGVRSPPSSREEVRHFGRMEVHLGQANNEGFVLVRAPGVLTSPARNGTTPLASTQHVPGGGDLLRLVPRDATIVAEPAGAVAAGEAVVAGGVVAAVSGSAILVCLTVNAVREGVKTPIDIADTFYGTQFGDIQGWIQRCFTPRTPDAHRGVVAAAQPSPESKQQDKSTGRIYVTYTKFNSKTSRHYSGRTSMIIDLLKPLRPQAEQAVSVRDSNHHVDEEAEPKGAGFKQAVLDMFDVGTAIDYTSRYADIAYWRIRGREQQLIDLQGGAQSDTREPHRTENVYRGVSKDNPLGRMFHDAATKKWGQLHTYTGN